MSNEFYNLELQCVPPNLVPYLEGVKGHQSCTLAGSQPDQTTVNGANYILTAFTYRRSHLWRNFGILIAVFLFFLGLTMLGMESAKPNVGGGAVTIFKRGQVPKKVEESIETGGRAADEESGQMISEKISEKPSQTNSTDSSVQKQTTVGGIAKNETVIKYQDVN